MPQGLYTDRPEHLCFKAYDDAPLKPEQVRVQTEFAAIKHGTELHVFSGRSPFQGSRFDGDLRLFVPTDDGGGDGILRRFVGNMVVGRVIEVGAEVTRHKVGARVYGYGPVAETATLGQHQAHPLVEPLTPEDVVCLDPALFAFAAVRDAQTCLGDNVVLSGLGAIGLLAIQMLKHSGVMNLIAVDPIAKRRHLAEQYGATATLDPTAGDVGLAVRDILGGVGADVAIEASGNYRALASALRSVRMCGRVVTLGYYKGKDSQLDLGAEWHHNRLELKSSMPDWGNPSREHPLWNRERMQQACLELFRNRTLVSQGLIDPIAGFAEADKAFMQVYRNPNDSVKLGVRF
ncbi:MAG: zinc-binding dehydrogenase [Phycisphaeraceae bacterium]